MGWTFKIYPTIGIARLGNCPNDGVSDFYVGPEVPGSVIVPQNGYKDSQGRVRRQAARFHIYCWEDGVFMGEIDSSAATITWTVELANTKAAFNQFHGVGHTNGPLRNAAVSDRTSLMIKPGPRTIGLGGQALFNTGQFLGTAVPLGEIQTDANGRLLVLGGFGASNSPTNAAITTFANNDGWHDDVSDGPVNATVRIGGQTYQAEGAWVICPPTRFAPPIPHPISLYDTLLQAMVDRYGYQVPATPSFTNDIYPLLRSQLANQWVSSKLSASYYAALSAVIPPPATAAQRQAIFQQFRPPSTPPTQTTSKEMPAIWTDYFADLKNNGWVNHPLTVTQYNSLAAWAAGNFVNDWVGYPSPGTAYTPDGLTRAALENCSGGPFFPGIETSFLTRDQYPFIEPFRLDGTALQAGDLTKQNAVPWQTDFYDCDFQSPLSWWPAARPEDVFPSGSSKYAGWERGVKSPAAMIQLWSGLGFLVQSGNAVVEIDRTI
ncbi:MAG: 3-isopropylmalate dehydrogenase [Verrucomicrobia bacterium]|nr:MAG: 3-isopropylmalate dehydrogenase [Verrucomicrobiota bacterium]